MYTETNEPETVRAVPRPEQANRVASALAPLVG
jgi:hypothetical protein